MGEQTVGMREKDDRQIRKLEGADGSAEAMAKLGAGCVRAVRSLADKSDGHRATKLHGHLTGEGGLVEQ